MAKKSKVTRQERYAAIRKLHGEIIVHIVALEKKYGQKAVSGAFARHTQVRRERAYLLRTQQDIFAKIAKLEGRAAQ